MNSELNESSALRQIADETVVPDGEGNRVPLSSFRTRFHDSLSLGFGSWKVMVRLEEANYVYTEHLKAGEEGAIAVAVSCFLPSKLQPATGLGWIGTGSNRFRVQRVIEVGSAIFHIGRVESGGFHNSKPSLHMWHDAYTPEIRAAERASRSRGISPKTSLKDRGRFN
jgi:hypothetical protein